MKDDLYFMSMAVLSVWREKNPKDFFCVILTDCNCEDYEIKVLHKDLPIHSLILEIFENTNYESGAIYVTNTPTKAFIEAAQYKNIGKIVYLPTCEEVPKSEGINILPFIHTFGRIIDVLSSYKPKVSFINKV